MMVVLLGITQYSSILDAFLKPPNIIEGGGDEDDVGVNLLFEKARNIYPDNIIDV